LKDSNASPKVKTIEEEIVEVCSLTRSISGVKRVCRSSEKGIRKKNKPINYLYGPTQTREQVG